MSQSVPRVSDAKLRRYIDATKLPPGSMRPVDVHPGAYVLALDLLDARAENERLRRVADAATALSAVVPGTQEYWLAEEALFAALEAAA